MWISAGSLPQILIAAIIALALGSCNQGCASFKAADTTKVNAAHFEGESKVTYTLIPGSLTEDPELASKIVAIPSIPGKNTKFVWYYPDGQKKMEFEGARSAIIEAAYAGISTTDAAKYAADAATFERTIALVNSIMDRATAIYSQRLAAQPPPSTGPNQQQQWSMLLQDPNFIREFKAALKDAPLDRPPTTLPSP